MDVLHTAIRLGCAHVRNVQLRPSLTGEPGVVGRSELLSQMEGQHSTPDLRPLASTTPREVATRLDVHFEAIGKNGKRIEQTHLFPKSSLSTRLSSACWVTRYSDRNVLAGFSRGARVAGIVDAIGDDLSGEPGERQADAGAAETEPARAAGWRR